MALRIDGWLLNGGGFGWNGRFSRGAPKMHLYSNVSIGYVGLFFAGINEVTSCMRIFMCY